jgi:hypothetical protein
MTEQIRKHWNGYQRSFLFYERHESQALACCPAPSTTTRQLHQTWGIPRWSHFGGSIENLHQFRNTTHNRRWDLLHTWTIRQSLPHILLHPTRVDWHNNDHAVLIGQIDGGLVDGGFGHTIREHREWELLNVAYAAEVRGDHEEFWL